MHVYICVINNIKIFGENYSQYLYHLSRIIYLQAFSANISLTRKSIIHGSLPVYFFFMIRHIKSSPHGNN